MKHQEATLGQHNTSNKYSWNEEQKMRYLLNSKARNFLMCAFIEADYEKVHSYKSSKEMWDALALAYERTSQDHESIDQMFGRLQTIINNLRSLGFVHDKVSEQDGVFDGAEVQNGAALADPRPKLNRGSVSSSRKTSSMMSITKALERKAKTPTLSNWGPEPSHPRLRLSPPGHHS
ncbi:hypothetical protein CR513_18611, partial [Mucuna pruriens]